MNAAHAFKPLPDPELRPLEAIASDIGELMAETVFQGIDRLEADWDELCKRWGLCGR